RGRHGPHAAHALEREGGPRPRSVRSARQHLGRHAPAPSLRQSVRRRPGDHAGGIQRRARRRRQVRWPAAVRDHAALRAHGRQGVLPPQGKGRSLVSRASPVSLVSLVERRNGTLADVSGGDRSYLAHVARGGEMLRTDKVDEARVELERASELRPGDARIMNLLGLTYFRLGLYSEARGLYNELVRRAPKDPALRLNLGLVHLKQGEVD